MSSSRTLVHHLYKHLSGTDWRIHGIRGVRPPSLYNDVVEALAREMN